MRLPEPDMIPSVQATVLQISGEDLDFLAGAREAGHRIRLGDLEVMTSYEDTNYIWIMRLILERFIASQ